MPCTSCCRDMITYWVLIFFTHLFFCLETCDLPFLKPASSLPRFASLSRVKLKFTGLKCNGLARRVLCHIKRETSLSLLSFTTKCFSQALSECRVRAHPHKRKGKKNLFFWSILVFYLWHKALDDAHSQTILGVPPSPLSSCLQYNGTLSLYL